MSLGTKLALGVVVVLAAIGLWCVLYVLNRAVRHAIGRSISRLQ